MAKGASKLDCIDALRGLAVLMVILYHLGCGDRPDPYHGPARLALAPFRLVGFSGVHLFLVLSGFCLTHSLIRRRAAGRPAGLRPYLAARWWRIAPPYYAAMAVYLAIPLAYLILGHRSALTNDLSARQVGVHLLFLHGLWADTIGAINIPFWTLSLEFQFYLALPLLFALAGRIGPWPVIGTVAASSLAWRAWLASARPEWSHLVNGLFLGRWTEFALGMGAAFWYNRPGRSPASGRVRALTAALAVALLATATARVAWGSIALNDFVLGAGYATLLVSALQSAEHGGRAAAIVSWAPLAWAGAVSYSLYLTHNLMLERTIQVYRRVVPHAGAATDAAVVALALAAALAGGWAFYHLIERHFVRSIDAPRPGATPPAPAASRERAAVEVGR